MAITTFTGDLSSVFPAGTSLEARPASNWPAHKRPPEAGTSPVGSATATATSASSGVLSLTGLADSTEYYVSDSAGTRYVRVTTFPERQEVMSNQAGQANGYPKLDSNAKVPWALIAGAEFHVKDANYGAVVDGATDDTTRIQNAINDAANVAPSTVVIEGGLALVTNLTPKNGVSIVGRNGGGLKATAGNVNPVIYRPNSTTGTFENVTIRDLRFQGDAAAVTEGARVAVYIDGTAGATLRNVRVLDCTFDDFASAAIQVSNFQQVSIRGNVVRNCARIAAGRNAINVVAPSGSTNSATFGEIDISQNKIDTLATAGIALVIFPTGFSGRATITGNVVKGSTGWAGIACESNGSHHHTVISGNVLIDNFTGIDIANTGGTSPQTADYRGFVVTGNVVDSTVTGGYGIRCEGSNAVIANNSIRVAGRAIYATGIDSTHRANAQTVANNQLVGNNASGTDYLLYVGFSDNCSVLGNRLSWESGAIGRGILIGDCASPHVALNHVNTPQRHGIEASDCVDAVFANNVLYDVGGTGVATYSGISLAGAAGVTIVRANEINDRRGGSAKMKYGIDNGVSSGTVRQLNNIVIGFVTSALNGTFTYAATNLESFTQPSLGTGYTNVTGSELRYTKLPDGMVHFAGILTRTVAAGFPAETMFTLPAGFRPAKMLKFFALVFVTGSTFGQADVKINTDGTVVLSWVSASLTSGTSQIPLMATFPAEQ